MNNNSFYRVLLLLLVILPSTGHAGQDKININLTGPRNYGYTLGDTLTLTAHIDSPAFYRLDQNNLPRPGPVNSWLVLNDIQLVEDSTDDYQIQLSYQIFKGVKQTTQLTIPALPIRFHFGRDSIDTEIPAWIFSYAPLIPQQLTDKQIQVQPLLKPHYLDTSQHYRLLGWLIAGISLLAFYMAWFYGKIPFLEHYSGAFGKACRELHRLAKSPLTEQSYRQALQIFHHALNELAGETIFHEQLSEFFKAFPAYQSMQQETGALFEISRRLFFTPTRIDLKKLSIQQIEELSQHYRKIERSLKWP